MVSPANRLFGPPIPQLVMECVLQYASRPIGTFEKPERTLKVDDIISLKSTTTSKAKEYFFRIDQIEDRAFRGEINFRAWQSEPKFPPTHLTHEGRTKFEVESLSKARNWHLRQGKIYTLIRIDNRQSYEYETETFELTKVSGRGSISFAGGYRLSLP